MHFIFYQNILSMHQSAFLRTLSETDGNSVTLIVEDKEEFGRGKQGWQEPDFGKCTIIIAPSDEQLFSFVDIKDAIHVFTGMYAFPMVERAFKHSCKTSGLRRMVFSEPWRSDGWRGYLRVFRYRWLAWEYADKVEAFLLTGRLGVESYIRAGFPKEKCHEWGYYTEMPDITSSSPLPVEHVIPRLIFIGTWDVRKNVLGMINVLKELSIPFECFLLGDGSLRPQVEAAVGDDKRFQLIGNVPNKQIGGWLSACDILVLPSIFDGWGAVVNEALMCGTRALVSERCGAASLIISSAHGEVFTFDTMKSAFESQLKHGVQSMSAREELHQWAKQNISGEAVVHRFLKICGKRS